jgi:hypothetical protein
MIEHPDISAIERTGYPPYISDNQDTSETRIEFIEEHIKDFINWVLASAPDAIDEFVDDHKHMFNKWMN